MKLTIEAETGDDYEQITKLHTEAFNGDNEGKLFEKLRKTQEYNWELSLVAKYKSQIIGHVLFYPVKINTGIKKCKTLALAPISVSPNFQNQGIGTLLIRKGLEKARRLGFKSVIVVGHSEYYPRFGFKKAGEYGISAPFDVPDTAFFAIELEKDGLKNCSGIIEYPKEFRET